jgi:hypothetical protein
MESWLSDKKKLSHTAEKIVSRVIRSSKSGNLVISLDVFQTICGRENYYQGLHISMILDSYKVVPSAVLDHSFLC